MEKRRKRFPVWFFPIALFVSLHVTADAVVAAGASDTAVSARVTAPIPALAGAGERWSGPALSGNKFTRLAFSPNFATDRTLYAGTPTHHFVSTDAGTTWHSSDLYTPNFEAGETQFAISRDGSKIIKSTDFGRTWIAVLSDQQQRYPAYHSVQKSPNYAADQTVLASGKYDNSSVFTFLLKSSDGGATWVDAVEGFEPGNYLEKIPFAFSPQYASDRTIFFGRQSQNLRDPEYFIFTCRGTAALRWTLPDPVTAIVVSPQFADDRTVYATTAGGIWRSRDGGETWQKASEVSGSLVHAPVYGTLFAATTAGLMRSDDGGTTWYHLGFAADALHFSPDFPKSRIIYAIHNGSGIHKSSDGGHTWSPVNDGLSSNSILSLAYSADGATLLAGTANGVYNNWGLSPPVIDRSPPVISSFSIPPLSSSLVVPITSFTAADNVTGYCVQTVDSAANCVWSSAPPASYVFSGGGIGVLATRTLYAFVRDSSGNVSRSRPATFSVVATLPPGEDFELENRGKLPWKGNWLYDETEVHEGRFSMKTPHPPYTWELTVPVTPSSGYKAIVPPPPPPSSRAELTVPTEEGVFSFWFKLHGFGPWGDSLYFSIDGKGAREWRGEIDWTKVSLPVSAGIHTFKWGYVKDRSGDETAAAWIDDIEFPPAVSDTAAPTATAFAIPSSSSTVTVPITTFTASDDRGVAGYCISEAQEASRCNWSATKPESYRFGAITEGTPSTRTLYARVVDTAGNISGFLSSTVTISLATHPTVVSTTPPDGAREVPAGDAVISAAFNQQMDTAGTSSGNFTLSRWIGFKAVAAGENHTVALKGDGKILAWGFGSLPPAGLSDVVAVAAGGTHSLALKQDGSVVAWGDNTSGQTTVPAGLSGVVAIAAGRRHSLALKSDGTVIAWGDSSEGQSFVPSELHDVAAVAAGGNNSVALKRDGTVVQWGNNPELIPAGLYGVTAVAAADHLALALKKDGTLTAWGYNNFGQTNVPEALADVTAIAVGGTHLHALRRDGSIHSWGSRDFGVDSPPAGLTGVIALTAGDNHCVALKNDGTLVSWGSNARGQRNIPEGILSPTSVATGGNHTLAANGDGTVIAWGAEPYGVPAGLSGVTAVATGYFHSLALKQDGTVVAWGLDMWGETEVPAGLQGVTAIAAGDNHSLALHGGRVSAWGDNRRGQLEVPADLSDVTAIAARRFHSLALKSDGSVVGWGDNSYGESAVPPEASGVVAIAAGDEHSVVVKKDGTVFSWGGYWSHRAALRPPSGLSGVTAIAAGRYTTLALKSDGTVVQWGYSRPDFGLPPPPEGLTGVVAIWAEGRSFLALKKDGTLVGWGAYGGSLYLPVLSLPAAGSVSWDADGRNATFTPAAPLVPGEWYLASINGRSRAGIPMAAPTAWRFTIPGNPVHLHLTGSGAGTVTSNPAGIAAGTGTSVMFEAGSRVTLTAAPAPGNSFSGWSGACTGIGACTLTMDAAKDVTATFTLNSYSIRIATEGDAAVTSIPAGVACLGASCSGSFPYGTVVTLSAAPAPGYYFTGWSGGGCSGTGSCAVRVNGALSLTASTAPGHPVTVTVQGRGSGSVSSIPSGIACITGSSNGCSSFFTTGSEVTLAGTASGNSTFSGWGGACSGSAPCRLTIDSAKSVSAGFSLTGGKIIIEGSTALYVTLEAALEAIATSGVTMRATGGSFLEDVIYSRPFAVNIRGGYTDAAFSIRGAPSVIGGSLMIRRGALRVDRLAVR